MELTDMSAMTPIKDYLAQSFPDQKVKVSRMDIEELDMLLHPNATYCPERSEIKSIRQEI